MFAFNYGIVPANKGTEQFLPSTIKVYIFHIQMLI